MPRKMDSPPSIEGEDAVSSDDDARSSVVSDGDSSSWKTVSSVDDELEYADASRGEAIEPLSASSTYEEAASASYMALRNRCHRQIIRRHRSTSPEASDNSSTADDDIPHLDGSSVSSREHRVELFKLDSMHVVDLYRYLDRPGDLNTLLQLVAALSHPPCSDWEAPVVLGKETFKYVDHHLCFTLVHYLLHALDEERARSVFKDHVKPDGKTSSHTVVNNAVKPLNEIRTESDIGECLLSSVTSSVFTKPCGESEKFMDFILEILTLTLWKFVEREMKTMDPEGKGPLWHSCLAWKRHVKALAEFGTESPSTLPYTSDELPKVMRRFRMLMEAMISATAHQQVKANERSLKVQEVLDGWRKIAKNAQLTAWLVRMGENDFEARMKTELDGMAQSLRELERCDGVEDLLKEHREVTAVFRDGLRRLKPVVSEIMPPIEVVNGRPQTGEEVPKHRPESSSGGVPPLVRKIFAPEPTVDATQAGVRYIEYMEFVNEYVEKHGDDIIEEVVMEHEGDEDGKNRIGADPVPEEVEKLEEFVEDGLYVIIESLKGSERSTAGADPTSENALPSLRLWDPKTLLELLSPP